MMGSKQVRIPFEAWLPMAIAFLSFGIWFVSLEFVLRRWGFDPRWLNAEGALLLAVSFLLVAGTYALAKRLLQSLLSDEGVRTALYGPIGGKSRKPTKMD